MTASDKGSVNAWHAFYSDSAAEWCGSHVYETPTGGTVLVTFVTRERHPGDYGWADAVYVGPVTEWVRRFNGEMMMDEQQKFGFLGQSPEQSAMTYRYRSDKGLERLIDARASLQAQAAVKQLAAALLHFIGRSGTVDAQLLAQALRQFAGTAAASPLPPATVACPGCGASAADACDGWCPVCHHIHGSGEYVPEEVARDIVSVQPIPDGVLKAAPLSPCCQQPTFEADGRRVCSKCRLTRPL